MLSTLSTVRRLAITMDQFKQLPRHPAYRYEYFDSHAHITPRLQCRTAALSLDRPIPRGGSVIPFKVQLLPFVSTIWISLTNLFLDAFASHPPFAEMTDTTRRSAVRECLRRTQEGGDGKLLASASVVACDAEENPVGFAVVTLVRIRQRNAATASQQWQSFDAPHLTWICVSPLLTRQGVGSLLLANAVAALKAEGWRSLYSTFLDCNPPSVFWHWKNGFTLTPDRIESKSWADDEMDNEDEATQNGG